VRFLALYTLLLAAAYSAIPHKTPWCMLSFLHAFVLLAGFGCARLIRLLARPWARALSLVVLIGCGAHLLWTCRLASFRYDADPRNPYVYAQTSRDLLNLVKRVEQISALDPRGEGMLVEVVAHPHETWPLPWYFRKLTSVGYWATAAEAPVAPKASVVIASEAEGEALARRLEGEYQVEFYGLRPSVLLLAYVRNDLWEEFLKRSGAAKRTGP
jgi:predicted membrane-bound mannosyltransferase